MAPRLTRQEKNAVILMGKTTSQGANCAATGYPMATVNKVFQAYYKEGRLANAVGNDSPRSTTAEEDQWIGAAAVSDPFLSV
ncbi:hypothetical protein HPB48_003128 [Haemaphysalis longicornis]|uniref:Uncharacterized protein n=1 Tax=Haemaphysalis longicornis TaxID=44386 RepID=A0A9J6GX56_HAELO|nr:hypothetical protein HPB48_003128 [Haemaphysalis longicornis]